MKRLVAAAPKRRRRRRDAAGLGRIAPVYLSILLPAILNGLLTGAVYALIALGLTLVYGVLHIINFAHGALLTAALFAAFFMHKLFGIDPYLAVFILIAGIFCARLWPSALRHWPCGARQ